MNDLYDVQVPVFVEKFHDKTEFGTKFAFLFLVL